MTGLDPLYRRWLQAWSWRLQNLVGWAVLLSAAIGAVTIIAAIAWAVAQ